MASSVEELLAKFRIRFPEFPANKISDDVVNMYLNDALCIFSLCDKAVQYLTAHLYVLDRDQSVSEKNGKAGVDDGLGQIESDKIGKKATTYKHQTGKGGKTESFYTSTPYGRKYLEFARKCPGAAFTVRVYD